jgi:hypothetical protein
LLLNIVVAIGATFTSVPGEQKAGDRHPENARRLSSRRLARASREGREIGSSTPAFHRIGSELQCAR